MKNLIIITFLLYGINSFGQAHNTTTGSACKYAKNRCTNMEGCPQCAACTAEDQKEKDAKIAEVKRRNDKIWADAKAKKDAEDKAYRDKIDKENAEAKRKAENNKVILTISNNSNQSNGKDLNIDDKKLVEMKKYSIKFNEEREMNSPVSISILYNSQPIFTTSAYSSIVRVSDKALIFYGRKPSINIDCNERESKNLAVFINEKGDPISIGGINSIDFASESNNVIKFSVLDGNCYPDNTSGASLLRSSLRGRTYYEYNLSDLSLITSRLGKTYAPCPCKK